MKATDAKAEGAARLAAVKAELFRSHSENIGLRGLVAAIGKPGWTRFGWLVAIVRAWLRLLARPRRARARRILRRAGLFDADWYLAANPDVAGAGVDPLDHYVRHGAHEGRRPNRFFVPEWYRQQCPHVAWLEVNPLLHYVRRGAARGLSPHPAVLPADLLRRQPAARSYPTILHYLLAEGLPESRRNAGADSTAAVVPMRPAGSATRVTAGSGRRVCAFSHFDAHGKVLGYVRHYLVALARRSFEIHFISTAPLLDPADRARLEAAGIRTYRRENLGRDFGSWQWGLREIPALSEAETLLLANDSVFGPLYDPNELFDAMRADPADVWGITDSPDVSWHLQSYFLCFSKRARESRAFREVFAQDFVSFRDKRAIIDGGEIALTQKLIRDGMALRAYCPQERIAPVPGRAGRLNPTYSAWDTLIIEQRCPFLKRELFLDYPNGRSEILHWRAVVEGFTNYDSTLIDEYIAHAAAGPGTGLGAK